MVKQVKGKQMQVRANASGREITTDHKASRDFYYSKNQ